MKDSSLAFAKVALVVTGALLSAMVSGETALRLFQYPSPIDSGWGWDQSPRRSLSAAGDRGQNDLGLRGTPFSYRKDDVVVLLVGDSQVEAATSSPSLIPERLLEAYLAKAQPSRSIKVFSLAASGWGHDQQLLALERYFETHRANLVLQWATPGNDFWENTFPDRSVSVEAGHIKPTFWFDGMDLQGPFFRDAVYLNRLRLWDLALRARLKFIQRSPQQYILDQWVAGLPSDDRHPDEKQAPHCAGYPTIDQHELLRKLLTLSPEQGVAVRTHEDVEHSRSHFSPYIQPTSAKDQYLIDITRALIGRMKRLAIGHGAPFRVFYPIRPDFDNTGKRGVRCIKTRTGKQFIAQWDMLDLLRSVIDKDDLIALSVSGGEELSVSATDRHFSDIGNDRAMHLLADELIRRNLLN